MASPDLVMYEEEYLQIKDTLHRLQADSNSKIVFLVDKNGQQIAVHGDMRGVDATSLASLTAGNVAATDGLATLIGEKAFSILFHERERANINISLVAQRAILVVFFDFRPLDLGTVRGFKTRFHLSTVPGQVFYDASRKLILKGGDGVVFVADSQAARMEANVESLQNLERNLKEQGYELKAVPYVVQFNKRDLPTALPADEMYRQLNFKGEPTFQAVAMNGTGVFDTLKAVAKLVLTELKKK